MAARTGDMRSIMTYLTEGANDVLDRIDRGNRSAAARTVLSAIMAAADSGDRSALDLADRAARASMPRTRAKMRKAKTASWRKSYVWLPQPMHARIERIVSASEPALTVPDFVRGAMIAASGDERFLKDERDVESPWMDRIEENDPYETIGAE